MLVFLYFVATVLAASFTNPVIWSDFPDNDVTIGPDGAYYFSASSFQFSPGAPILKSYDLVNWNLIGHSVPHLDFGSAYDMEGTPAYVGGIWASTMRYRKSRGLWYWIGCVGFSKTYIYTSTSITGKWTLASVLDTCYYDCGLLIDDDDVMYVVHGNSDITISTLSSDGLHETRSQKVFSGPQDHQTIEGNRLYKIDGTYYILNDDPSGTTLIWRSKSLYGQWEHIVLQSGVRSPIPQGGLIDQGSLVQAPNGKWYFMSCSWSYPAGRIPVLAPITWSNGWPSLVATDNTWGKSYEFPANPSPMPAFTGTDQFSGTSLSPAWEFNFNPDTSKYHVNNGLVLQTATVTTDLYKARNTLTHRVHGAKGVGTVQIDFSQMADGDVCGLAAFRDQSAWIGIRKAGSSFSVFMVSDATQNANNNWVTISNGTVKAKTSIPAGKAWLRATLDVAPASDRLATFEYSTDGHTFSKLGTSFRMTDDWHYFTGYRYGIFNYATRALGGSIKVLSFTNEALQ